MKEYLFYFISCALFVLMYKMIVIHGRKKTYMFFVFIILGCKDSVFFFMAIISAIKFLPFLLKSLVAVRVHRSNRSGG